jgi:hypothetical protein
VGGRPATAKIGSITARIAVLESQRAAAVAAALAEGATWAEIGSALGVSAQAAHKRFRWVRTDPATGEVWFEPPLPI